MIELSETYYSNLALLTATPAVPVPNDPIKTTNQNGGEIKTRKASNEQIGNWVNRHFLNIVSEWEAEEYELTDEICTCWFDANDDPYCECTERNSGESDGDFLSRHATDATGLMVQHPPAP